MKFYAVQFLNSISHIRQRNTSKLAQQSCIISFKTTIVVRHQSSHIYFTHCYSLCRIYIYIIIMENFVYPYLSSKRNICRLTSIQQLTPSQKKIINFTLQNIRYKLKYVVMKKQLNFSWSITKPKWTKNNLSKSIIRYNLDVTQRRKFNCTNIATL